ncbi:hypothetical protein [Haloferula sp. BvORR071]|uniref:hypothetical protein n=1 Tax=Haloferula sp. BvORR071 TaxID=1396141 RepID=UPI00054EAAD9|nr:hypothetical protein [Haloferula sp. BvORR071]
MDSELPRPSLLRSPLLWCGLMLLVFLGWAWRDSVGRWSYVRAGSVSAHSMASGVTILRMPGRSGWESGSVDPPPMSRLGLEGYGRYPELLRLRLGRPELSRALAEKELVAFFKTGLLDGREPDPVVGMFYHGAGGSSRSVRMVFIPYWCVMLAVAGVWAGLIYWRYRSIQEHRAELAGAAAENDSGHES